jgi:hypothetical protein
MQALHCFKNFRIMEIPAKSGHLLACPDHFHYTDLTTGTGTMRQNMCLHNHAHIPHLWDDDIIYHIYSYYPCESYGSTMCIYILHIIVLLFYCVSLF